MNKHIKVGSRDSVLAKRQAQLVMDIIKKHHPELTLELVTMKTTGDLILDRTLDKIGGKGLFVKELDQALREGRVDICVHSCKDVPMELHEDLPLLAFSKREEPRDVLILPEGVDSLEKDKNLPIGSSSARRKLYLSRCYPDFAVAPIRGNLQSRLEKLDNGDYSALVLAGAGLQRLGLSHRIHRYFSVEEMLPSGGQGILAVQGRRGEELDFLSCVHHKNSGLCALAERGFTAHLDGGCSSPVASYASIEGEIISIRGMYVDEEGNMIEGAIQGQKEEGISLAVTLAEKLKRGERDA